MKLMKCAILVLLLTSFAASQDRVLANGDPPLTQAMVDRGRDFIEWLFEAPLTSEQRKTVEESIISSWRTGNKQEIAGTLELIKSAEQIAQLPEEARASVRAQIQPEVVSGLRKDAGAESKWMLAIYDAAHTPIAPGQPALTRQMSDAQAEMFAFILSEASGQRLPTDRKFLDDWSRSLVPAYTKMDEVQRQQIARAPIEWANLRFGWSRMSEQQRAEARKRWASELQSIVPQSTAQQKVNASFGRVEQILAGKSLEQVSAVELNQAASELEKAAAALSAEQSAESKQMTIQIKQTAVALRNAAAAKGRPSPSTSVGTSTDLNKELQKLQSSQDSFRNMMNMSMQMHYTRSNSINILGGNPYRYVNSFGVPY